MFVGEFVFLNAVAAASISLRCYHIQPLLYLFTCLSRNKLFVPTAVNSCSERMIRRLVGLVATPSLGKAERYPRFMQHAGVEDKHATGISPPSGIL